MSPSCADVRALLEARRAARRGVDLGQRREPSPSQGGRVATFALPPEHQPSAAVKPGGLPVERQERAGRRLGASAILRVGAPGQCGANLFPRARGGQPYAAPILDFGFHRPTKD